MWLCPFLPTPNLTAGVIDCMQLPGFFLWMLGILTQVFMLVWQPPHLLSHLQLQPRVFTSPFNAKVNGGSQGLLFCGWGLVLAVWPLRPIPFPFIEPNSLLVQDLLWHSPCIYWVPREKNLSLQIHSIPGIYSYLYSIFSFLLMAQKTCANV